MYAFAAFRFVPEGSGITPANVLARLDEDDTYVELIVTQRGPQFQFRYRFDGDLLNIINGDYDASQTTVTLTAAETYEPLLEELLLTRTLRLSRETGDELALEATRTVNLEAFDPEQYGGANLTAVRGQLIVRLVPEARVGERAGP